MKHIGMRDQTGPLDPFDEGSWTESERFYFEGVRKLFNERADVRFSNGKPAHAVYLMVLFFQMAQRHMRIFSGSLTRRTSAGILIYEHPRIISASADFLCRPDTKLLIVLEEDIDVDHGQSVDEHPLIAEIQQKRDSGDLKGSLTVSKAHNADLTFLRNKQFLYHLVIMDEQAWRIETRPDPNNVQAQVNAGDQTGARTLAHLFDNILLHRAEPLIEIPDS